MRRLELDFGGRRSAAPWAGRVLLALALAFALDVGISYNSAKRSLENHQASIAAAAQPRSAPQRKASAEEIALVRDTVRRLGTPWERLFGALEAAANDQVALLGIEPDPKSGTVLISGDGRDYLAALTYVLNLSQAEALRNVHLVRHEAKPNDPNGAVNFTVSAGWSEERR
jgi:HAMP domain-containing protein